MTTLLVILARRLPLIAAAALCAASFGLFVSALSDPVQSEPDRDGEILKPNPRAAMVADAIEPRGFAPDALIAKPLFSPTRAPPPPAPVAMPPAPFVPPPIPEEPAPAYMVRGIVATPGRAMALLRVDEQSKPAWLAQGGLSPEGWLLTSLTATTVTLSKEGRALILRLEPKHGGKSQLAVR